MYEIKYSHLPNGTVEVRFDDSRRLVGRIKREKGGWRYWVAGTKHKGDLFPTIEAVQRSFHD